ncbi:MAG: FecR family protein [Bdellovibrionales bacterium]|nr:FecR family protein [Bdellovibrionales bacterium]
MQIFKAIWFFSFLFLPYSVFAQSSYGVFMVVKGDVKVDRKDGSSQAAKVQLKVYPGDTVKAGVDSRAKITMSDRNNIHISPATTVRIAGYTEGENKNVELQLNEGKVRNEVKNKYDGEKSKFIIKTPSAVAGVRGTDFLVDFDTKTQKTEVVTFKGSVAFSSFASGNQVGEAVIVNKQQSAATSGSGAPTLPKNIPEGDFRRFDSETMVKNFGQGTSATPPSGAAVPTQEMSEPLKDTSDKTPDAFDKMPTADANRPPAPQPIKQLLPPPPNTRVNDAIRNKTDKTKVIIQPTVPPTGTVNPNRGK